MTIRSCLRMIELITSFIFTSAILKHRHEMNSFMI